MAVREQTIRLHLAIKDEFERLSSIQEYGVPKYSTDYVLNKVADKFFKSAKTVENIVFGRTGYYPDASQTTLDL